MPLVSTTLCPACGQSVPYDPTLGTPYAACQACGQLAPLPDRGPGVVVNGRPVAVRFRPSPLAVVAIAAGVAAGVAAGAVLAVLFVVVAFAVLFVGAVALLLAAFVRRLRGPRDRRDGRAIAGPTNVEHTFRPRS